MTVDLLVHRAGGWRYRKSDIVHGPNPVATVETFARPTGAPAASTKFPSVTVNGSGTATYGTPVEFGETSTSGSFANFAFKDGEATVVVTHESAVTSAVILPRAKGVTPVVAGSTVTFTVSEPGSYVLWVNGDKRNGLYVHANPLEAKPAPGDVTYYYGPGYYEGTLPGGGALTNKTLVLQSGQSVYFDGGAYWRGHVHVGPQVGVDRSGYNVSNISVDGYGVIDSQPHASLGATESSWGRPMLTHNVNGATIRGVTLLAVTHWGFLLTESINVDLEHVKMINWRNRAGDTPDGIDSLGSSYLNFRHVFIRAHDDASALKTFKQGNGAAAPNGWSGSVEQVSYEDCVFINGPGGNGSEIGYENFDKKFSTSSSPTTDYATAGTFTNRKPLYVRDISYRRHTVVKFRDPAISYRMAALGIHLVDRVPLSNVLYEDVTVEDVVGGQFSIWFGSFLSGDYDPFTDSASESARCTITGVTLRRVNITTTGVFPVHLQGGGPTKPMTGVTFDQVRINGVLCTAATQASGAPGAFTWEQTNTEGPTFL